MSIEIGPELQEAFDNAESLWLAAYEDMVPTFGQEVTLAAMMSALTSLSLEHFGGSKDALARNFRRYADRIDAGALDTKQ